MNPLFYFIPWLVILIGAGFLIMQGWMLNNEKIGYSKNPKYKKHPEMKDVNKDDKLLYVRFEENEEDKDYNILRKRIQELQDNDEEMNE